MTRIVYAPETPALRMVGHAGGGEVGRDPVCAALSMLMYTLLAALPAEGVERSLSDGCCFVRGGDGHVYEVIAAGLRLLAAAYPALVSMEEET